MIEDWPSLRIYRNRHLAMTDFCYCSDFWATLSTTQKGQINSWRQELRDMPADYDTPAEAYVNMPPHPDWLVF